MRPTARYTRSELDRGPMVVFFETTQACDLVCKHCRACAQPMRHPDELSTDDAKRLIDQLATFDVPPLLVLTGGDPLKRHDIYELIAHAQAAGVMPAMTPSATPLVTKGAIDRMVSCGLKRLAVSLDGVDAATHDAFRGVPGSFDRTLEIMRDARAAGLPLQINTTITTDNVAQVDALAEMLGDYDLVLWSVFFLVPVGRGVDERRISPEQYEVVFEKLWHHAETQPYAIKTTEAPHYRRFILQHGGNPQADRTDAKPLNMGKAPLGINDGKGVMFVSHTGRVFPSGFLPVEGGRFPAQSVVDIYRDADVFVQLRDADLLEGKCGDCEFRQVCGGSRARSFALTGNILGSEPDCLYQPVRNNNTASTARHEMASS